MTHFWRYFASNGQGCQDCPALGIKGSGVPLFPSLVRRWRLEQSSGVEVWAVRSRGLAAVAGVRQDDIVLRIGEEAATRMSELPRLLRPLRRGKPLTLVLIRAGQLVERLLVPDDALDAGRHL